MVTQGEMLERCREVIDEAEAHQWQDTELRRWINAGCREVAAKTESLQAVSDITGIATTQQYTAPTDAVRLHTVEWVSADGPIYPLEFVDYNNCASLWGVGQTTTEGIPSMFTLWGVAPTLKIILYPTPSDSGIVRVHYYKFTTDLAVDGTATNTPLTIPSGWEELVVHYVEYRALRKDADPRWQEAKSLFDEGIADLLETSQRWIDAAGMITTGSGMNLPGWLYGDGGY